MSFLKTHRTPVLIIVAVIAAAAVAVGALFATGLIGPKTYSLENSPQTTRAPLFAKDIKVAGYRAQATETPGGYTRTISLAKGNLPACTIIYQTTYLPAYQAGQGDEYLTKNYVYQQSLQLGRKPLGALPQVQIPTTQGDRLTFVTGRIGYTNSYDKKKVDVRLAVRAVDKVYRTGASLTKGGPTKDEYGSDLLKGEPLLYIYYQCSGENTSAAVWDQILAAAKVELR